MEFTQELYDELKQKQNDGVLTDDEGRRLLKQMEQQGFEQSRLKRERAAKDEAARARAGLTSSPTHPEGEGDGPTPPEDDAEKVKWVTFAKAVNAKLDEDEQPIPNPDDRRVTKQQLIEAYRNFADGAGE